MRFWPLLLLLVASTASAKTIFVCRGPDPMQLPCGNTCVVQAWDKAHHACIEAMDTTDAAFISYSDRVPTQAMIDQQYESDLLENEVFRALIRTIAEIHGVTPASVIQKMKDNR